MRFTPNFSRQEWKRGLIAMCLSMLLVPGLLAMIPGLSDARLNFLSYLSDLMVTVIFLRKIVPGATDDSFGIEVAKLAGIPNAVISRAREILAELESGQREVVAAPVKEADDQISMMDMRGQDICAELEKITLETLTPIEAMNELYRLKKMLN